jgi:hypothetical protein
MRARSEVAAVQHKQKPARSRPLSLRFGTGQPVSELCHPSVAPQRAVFLPRDIASLLIALSASAHEVGPCVPAAVRLALEVLQRRRARPNIVACREAQRHQLVAVKAAAVLLAEQQPSEVAELSFVHVRTAAQDTVRSDAASTPDTARCQARRQPSYPPGSFYPGSDPRS